jgi:DNA-binding LacI/PurR family transcriptional regulator
MQYLFELGHRDIAFISGPLALGSARARAEAFQVALREHDITIRRDWLQEGDHRVEGGHHAMMRILESGRLPTAVLGSNDLTAIGAMGAIHEKGLAIPGDISVVGFDDIELSAYTLPALTTVHVPRRELASTAFRALFRGREETPDKNRRRHRHVIKTKLIVRQSTGEARTKRTPVTSRGTSI